MGVKSVTWHRVLQRNYAQVLEALPSNDNTIVFNLCDGQVRQCIVISIS